MTETLLEIELVPQTSHFKNLRSELKAADWDLLRKNTYKQAGYCCEICGGKGHKWPVECHEKWNYENGVQTLTGLIALCPSCHEVKHFGLAQIRGRDGIAKKHMMKVNKWTDQEATAHISEAFQEWGRKSLQSWKLDIIWAHKKIEELKNE